MPMHAAAGCPGLAHRRLVLTLGCWPPWSVWLGSASPFECWTPLEWTSSDEASWPACWWSSGQPFLELTIRIRALNDLKATADTPGAAGHLNPSQLESLQSGRHGTDARPSIALLKPPYRPFGHTRNGGQLRLAPSSQDARCSDKTTVRNHQQAIYRVETAAFWRSPRCGAAS